MFKVHEEVDYEFPELRNDKCFSQSSPDNCDNAWSYKDEVKQTIKNSFVKVQCGEY